MTVITKMPQVRPPDVRVAGDRTRAVQDERMIKAAKSLAISGDTPERRADVAARFGGANPPPETVAHCFFAGFVGRPFGPEAVQIANDYAVEGNIAARATAAELYPDGDVLSWTIVPV